MVNINTEFWVFPGGWYIQRLHRPESVVRNDIRLPPDTCYMLLISQGRGRMNLSYPVVLFLHCLWPFLCKLQDTSPSYLDVWFSLMLQEDPCCLHVNYPPFSATGKQKPGAGSTLEGSRSCFKWVEIMCEVQTEPQLPSDCSCCCYGLTTLALIQGDTQPSNLLSAQFQWTMEFRACRYTILLSALRLAARLMRLRLPTREPNGVKTKVLLRTNNPWLHYHWEVLVNG